MNPIKTTCALIIILALGGCSNLQEVRDYAKESAKLSEYTELTTRFRDTYQREQPYLTGLQSALAQKNDVKRKEAYDDLLKINQTVSIYMQTLATLAGEDAFDLSKEIDSLAGGIKTYPDIGINEKHANAISSMTKVVAKWATSSFQNKAVKDLIIESDESLQTTLNGMSTLVRYYKKTNDNERESVLGLFEVEIAFAGSPQDKLLATLARAHVQTKLSEYNGVQQKYQKAEKGIKSVAEGHTKLLNNINDLSKADVKIAMKKFADDIKSIRSSLQIVRN